MITDTDSLIAARTVVGVFGHYYMYMFGEKELDVAEAGNKPVK